MGIRPNRDGLIPPIQPDSPENRYGDWLDELDNSGEIIGEVWKDTDAKATSANQAVSELAGRTTQYVDSTMGERDRIPVTGQGGWLYSRDNPVHSNHLARKGYVDESITNAPPKAHKHMSADITDTTLYADPSSGTSYVIPRTGGDGFLYSRDNPTQGNHLARKGYVDGLVNPLSEAFDSHKHVSADVTDTALYVDSSMGREGAIPRTGVGGWLYSRDNPVHSNHLARKGYVDDRTSALESRITQLEGLLEHAVIAVPPANLADLPAGQVYLDTSTLILHTKE